MMSQYFYKQEGRVAGPVSEHELKFLLSSGRLGPETLVSHQPGGEWRPIDSGPGRKTERSSGQIHQRKQKQHNAGSHQASGSSHGGSSTPRDVNSPAVLQQTVKTPAPAMPGLATDPDDNDKQRVRNQVIAGIVAALLLAMLLYFCRDHFSGLADSGSVGNGLADAAHSFGTDSRGKDSRQGAADSGRDGSGPDDTEPPVKSDIPAKDSSADPSNDDAGAGDGSDAPDADGPTDKSPATPAADRPGTIAADTDSQFTVSFPGEAMFFGIKAEGHRFSFVVDHSGSMSGERLERAKNELSRCIQGLPDGVEVTVVFFSDVAVPYPEGTVKLDPDSRSRLADWVRIIPTAGGTSPEAGTRLVLNAETNPDVVFLLTDGDFDNGAVADISQQNRGRQARINTVALVSRGGEDKLKQIASQNRGDYRFVP